METLNLSYVYADRDGYDECMRAGLLKTSLPATLYSKTPMLGRFCMCISDRLLLQIYSK